MYIMTMLEECPWACFILAHWFLGYHVTTSQEIQDFLSHDAAIVLGCGTDEGKSGKGFEHESTL